MVKKGNFTFVLLELIFEDQLVDLPSQERHLLVKNANFTFLLLELLLEDQLVDLPPVEESCGLGCQIQISTVRAHI